MKRLFAVLLVFCMVLATLAGCSRPTEAPETTEEAPVTIRLGGLKGPTTMGMVKLLSDAEAGTTQNTYTYQLAASGDELAPLMLQGELDIISVPVNLGSILCAKSGGKVQMAAVSALGVLYMVEKGEQQVHGWDDLRGQTIYATGKGTTPEYTLRHLLAANGLDPDQDVTVEFKSEPTEVVAQMATEDHAVAMLPQPFVMVAKGQLENLSIVMDLTEEWNRVSDDSQLVTAAVLVRSEFAESCPQQLEIFLSELAASVDYVNEQPASAAVLVENYGIVKAPIAEKAIPFCNLVCITGNEMMAASKGYLEVLYNQNPASVGGELPADSFYYGAE